MSTGLLLLRWIVPRGDDPDYTGQPFPCLDREAADALLDERSDYAAWELRSPDGTVEHCYTGTGHPRVWMPGPVLS